jgi:uncharacterized protein YkwD
MLPVLLCGVVPALYAKTLPSKRASDSAIQNEILIYINQYRHQHGLAPLAMNNKIVIEAKKHSMDMATHKIPFGHSYFKSRINCLHSQIKDSGAGAENVAYNYKDARDVVKNWLLSSGHKRNIDGNYNLTGIGIARDKLGKIYFTQIFLNTHGNNIYASRRPFSTLLRGAPWSKRG